MQKTIAFPIDPWFQLGDPRVLLALLLVCGQGSYFIAFTLIPGGAPPEAYAHTGSAISAALFTVGLVLVAVAQRSR